MIVILTPQTEMRLREKAEREGQDVNTVADAIITATLEWEAREFEETVAGIQRGLQAAAEGRVKPLERVIAEARAKHGFPEQWPFGNTVRIAHIRHGAQRPLGEDDEDDNQEA